MTSTSATPDKFCSYCGSYHIATSYPKECQRCGQTTWSNPKPVAVLIQPIMDGKGRDGVLLGKRGIAPCIGQWALIGGFMDDTDKNLEHTAVRELLEETGLNSEQDSITLTHSFSNGKNVLVFSESNLFLHVDELEKFVANEECPEVRVAWEPEELCFPSHTAALKSWFERRANSKLAAFW